MSITIRLGRFFFFWERQRCFVFLCEDKTKRCDNKEGERPIVDRGISVERIKEQFQVLFGENAKVEILGWA